MVLGSRSAKIIATASAARRRATNPSAPNDGRVEPLSVVYQAQDRALRSGRGEQAENRNGDQEPVGSIARGDARCDSERVLLRFWELVKCAEQRRPQALNPREWQLHLRLDADDLDDPQARRLPRGVTQQRGLSDDPAHRWITRTAL